MSECSCVSSGVRPLSQVLEKKHMEVKQCSTVLFLRFESNGGHLNPVWSFSTPSLVCLHFLKNDNENKQKKTFSFFSLFSYKCTVAIFFLFPRRRGIDLIPPSHILAVSYSSSSVGRSSSRSRSSLGNGRLCVTPVRRDTGRLSSSTSVGSSFTCTGWLYC